MVETKKGRGRPKLPEEVRHARALERWVRYNVENKEHRNTHATFKINCTKCDKSLSRANISRHMKCCKKNKVSD